MSLTNLIMSNAFEKRPYYPKTSTMTFCCERKNSNFTVTIHNEMCLGV